MKKEKIEPLSVVKAFTTYFLRRAKRVADLKNTDFVSYHIDYFSRSCNLEVWFFAENNIVAKVRFTSDGRRVSKEDYRDGK